MDKCTDWRKTGKKHTSNPVTFIIDLLTSISSIFLLSLVSVAQAIFLLEYGQTELITPLMPQLLPARVITNEYSHKHQQHSTVTHVFVV